MKALHTAVVFLGMAAATAWAAPDAQERQARPERAGSAVQHADAEHMKHMGQMGPARKGDRQHPPLNEPMTREQFLERSAKHFERMDLDQNGTVSPDEARSVHEQMRKKQQERGEMRKSKHEGSESAVEPRRRAPGSDSR